ncbi:MAG: phage tail tape measure protein [Clostridium sp.]|uniref:phage tail tape measure protein n=1 Tax=Clostridium sp. TaxID=1506 RepID=UPI003F2BF91A
MKSLQLITSVATDSLSALGLEVKDLEGYLDIVANAQSSTNQSAEQLMNAYLRVGSSVKNLGIPLEESAAALGIFANNGLKGTAAGTKLSSILTGMTAQTSVAAKGFGMMGVKVYDNNGKFRGLTTVLKEAKKGLGKLNQEQQQNAIKMAVGTRNVNAFMQLVDAAADGSMPGLTEEFKNSDGALDKLRATMEDTTKNKLQLMKSALEGAGEAIFRILAPAVEKIANGISNLANAFTNANPMVKSLIVGIAGIAAVIGPIMLVVSGAMKLGLACKTTSVQALGLVKSMFGIKKVSGGATNSLKQTTREVTNMGKAKGKSMTITSKATGKQMRFAKSLDRTAKDAQKMAAGGKMSQGAANAISKSAENAAKKTGLMASNMGRTFPAGLKLSQGTNIATGSVIRLTSNAAKTAASVGTLGNAAGGVTSSLITTGATSMATGGSILGLAGKVALTAAKFTGWGLAATAATAVVVGTVKALNTEAIPQLDLFAEHSVKTANGTGETMVSISEHTQGLMTKHFAHMQELSTTFNLAMVNGGNMTKEQIEGVGGVLASNNRLIMEEVKKDTEGLTTFMVEQGAKRLGLTTEEYTKALAATKVHEENTQKSLQAHSDRIMEILKVQKGDKVNITNAERKELEQIQIQINNMASKLLTESEAEQKVIMQRIVDSKDTIDKKGAVDLLQRAETLKTDVVKKANEQYDESIKAAENFRKIAGPKEKDFADKMIKNAEEVRKKTIAEAEEQKKGVIDKLMEAYPDLGHEVDLVTGEIRNSVDAAVRKWATATFPAKKLEYQIRENRVYTSSSASLNGGTGPNGRSSSRFVGGGRSITQPNLNPNTQRSIDMGQQLSTNQLSSSSSSRMSRMSESNRQTSSSVSRPIIVQNMNIRKESDIEKISRQLFDLEKNQDRARGVVREFRR